MTTLRKTLPEPVKTWFRPAYHLSQKALRGSFRALFKMFGLMFGKKRFLRLFHFISNEVDTTIEIGGITFQARDPIPFHRAVTLLTKEPDMIAWIDDVMSEGDVFYDVGANIGVFSLYAAIHKKALVYSFEPLATSYDVLNENIHLNGLSDQIKAINIAMHNKMVLADLNVSELKAGKAGNSFEVPMGSRGNMFEPTFRQGMIGMKMDEFVETFDVPFPNFVKIDVDANEPEIIEGMEKILSDPRLKGLAIEINTAWPRQTDLAAKISSFGFEKLNDDRYVNRSYQALGPMLNYFFTRT